MTDTTTPLRTPVKGVVYGQSGSRCMNPDCRVSIVSNNGKSDVWNFDAAHICGEQPGAERHDAAMSETARNSAANLLALCGTCHGMIDKPGASSVYTTAMLLEWKGLRSREIDDRVSRKVLDVGFAELHRVVRILATGNLPPDADMTVDLVTPDVKLRVNGLSGAVRSQVQQGLSRASEVRRYLDHERRLQPDIVEVVRSAIVSEYRSGAERSAGDALFRLVWDNVAAGLCADADRAAALVVVCYFFETCDIFERA